MACGTPVVVADNGALRETAGGAAPLASPAGRGPRRAASALLADAASASGSAPPASQRAASFTWDRTARAIDALLSERIAAPRA